MYEADSEYGLQIISDKNVKTIALGADTFEEAKTSYNNAIETLNNEAEAYINSEYVTDARCVGSVPTVENGMFVDKDSENPGPVTLEFEYNGSTSIDCKGLDTNYITDTRQMRDVADVWTTGEDYWLACRYVNSVDSNCYFYVRHVDSEGNFVWNHMCYIYDYNKVYGSIRETWSSPMFLSKNRH